MSTIGKHLRALREERGLSQKEVANLMGVVPSHISMLETSAYRDPLLSTVLRYCKAIGARMVIKLEDQ